MTNIEKHRHEIGRAMELQRFLVIGGPCSDQLGEQIAKEGEALAQLSDDNLLFVHRRPIWKPRTLEDAWHGLAETEPDIALRGLVQTNKKGKVPIALEIGHPEHQPFIDQAALVWTGARSVGDRALAQVLKANPSVPFGVKTGLNGELEGEMATISEVTEERAKWGMNSVPGLVIHRSGGVASPSAWENQVIADAQKLKGVTSGAHRGLIIDVAHGAEMAHDPRGRLRKTIHGQIEALDHTIQLLKLDRDALPNWKGIMVETSDVQTIADRTTDPNMPISAFLEKMIELKELLRKFKPSVKPSTRSVWEGRNHI